jgi:hypothetical protein
VSAVVRHAVDETHEVSAGFRAQGAGARVGHVAEDDLAADCDFVGAEAEGYGLDGQGLVDVG